MAYKKITNQRKYQRLWVATKRLNEKWDAFESKLGELTNLVNECVVAT